jgi:glyoxylase-like metal-dependent hydrolase (beta-lactamase superfamily II)
MLSVQPFTFNPLQENTYVLYNEKKECCIIDPGCYFDYEEKAILDFVQQNGLTPVLLLNTHCHLDHIFGNQFIYQTFDLPLHLHPLEEQVLQFGPATGQKWNLEFTPYNGPLHFITETDVLKLGDEELHILFTPGHSPGSISFYSKPHKFLISGDVLFEGSIGRTDLPGGSIDVLETSIKTHLYT